MGVGNPQAVFGGRVSVMPCVCVRAESLKNNISPPLGKRSPMTMRIWDADLLCAASVVGFMIALSLVARSIGQPNGTGSAAAAPQKGREMLAQSQEWTRLSEQDTVPLFAYRHAAFALAYLNAARLIAPDSELQRHGTDVHLLYGTLEARLANLSKKITKSCAPANPKHAKATSVSWI